MTSEGQEVARRRLSGETYRPLWSAARDRLERSSLAISNRPVKVDVTGDARVAIAGLVGISPAGSDPLSIRLDRLDQILRAGAAAIDLISLLEWIYGSLVDRRNKRATRVEMLASIWHSLEQHPATSIHPQLEEWLDGLRSSGAGIRRAGSADDLEQHVRQGLDVLARLPVQGVPLAVLAAEVTGDAHALDRSATLGSLVTSGLRYLEVLPVDVPNGPASGGVNLPWREAWSRVGVVCDDVSASVLVLNLELTSSEGPATSAVEQHRRVGMPLRLTLQQLRSESFNIPADAVVRSCENPSVVVQAASSLGARSAPLICSDGSANSAVDELVRQVRSSGARVAHHGDFDWGGVSITNVLIDKHEVDLWRFSTLDYLEVCDLGSVPLTPPEFPIVASWDPGLVPAMHSAGRCVFEEQVIQTLISDLRI